MKKMRFGNFRCLMFVMIGFFYMFRPMTALAADSTTITLADKSVRIIRGATLLKGIVGVTVQKDDIVETGASGAQIEASGDLMIALAPETKIYIVNVQPGEAAHAEIILLNGWVKLFNKFSGTNSRAVITSPLIKVGLEKGFSIVHAVESKVEMFAEEGLQTVAELEERGKTGAEMKINREQYAFRSIGQPIKIMPRPPKEFIAEMPITFRDPVVAAPDRLKGIKVAAVKEREIDYVDIAPWLKSNFVIKKNFVSRFSPRLKDASFRKQLDDQLGQSADWKPILHPPPPKPKDELSDKH